jgi:hypothetical protein
MMEEVATRRAHLRARGSFGLSSLQTMPAPFSRTLRAIEADRLRRATAGLIPAVILLALWTCWFIAGRVRVYEVSATAALAADREPHPIAAAVAGPIARIDLNLGRRVRAGDVVAQIESSEQQALLAEQRARAAALDQQIAAVAEQIRQARQALAGRHGEPPRRLTRRARTHPPPTPLVASGAVMRGAEAAGLVRSLLADGAAAVPDAYRTASEGGADEEGEQVRVRGAVLMRVHGYAPGDSAAAADLSRELAAALAEPPLSPARQFLALLLQSGLAAPAAVAGTLSIAATSLIAATP